jgi:uncharacterized protein
MKFIVDTNVGKLVKWLRVMGYDTVFFREQDDARIVSQALREERTILTRDTHLMEWGVIRTGRIIALLLQSDKPKEQLSEVVRTLALDVSSRSFTLCLACNQTLLPIEKPLVKDRVPPYVFRTQDTFMGCPLCHLLYWRGTHWHAMLQQLHRLNSAA